MRRRIELIILTLLAFYWLAPILPMPQPKTPRSKLHLLADPTALYASRTYNGTTDLGAWTVPDLSSYQKIAIVFWLKVASWTDRSFRSCPTANCDFPPNAGFVAGAVSTFSSANFCGTNVFLTAWAGTVNTNNVVGFPEPSVNVWHRYVLLISIPGAAGNNNAQFYEFVDGMLVVSGGQTNCTNFNFRITSFQGAGITGNLMPTQAGTMADVALYASTDNTSGIVLAGRGHAGWSGVGLPTDSSCGGTAPCTANGDIYALGHYDGGNPVWYPANSHCISAVPIWYSPHWGVDSPEPSYGTSGGGHNVTITGTAATAMPPGMQPCPLD